MALSHLRKQVPDRAARATDPHYAIGCKRVLISNDYYPALQQPNVALETAGIARIDEQGVVLKSGGRVDLDLLVVATGFEAAELPIAERIHGRQGRRLSDQWRAGGQAFACTAVSGFPNFFLMLGPNTGLGAGSMIFMVETQINYIKGAVAFIFEHGAIVDPDPDAQRLCREHLPASAGTVWLDGGCSSWYLHPQSGKLTTLWPDFATQFRKETARSPGRATRWPCARHTPRSRHERRRRNTHRRRRRRPDGAWHRPGLHGRGLSGFHLGSGRGRGRRPCNASPRTWRCWAWSGRSRSGVRHPGLVRGGQPARDRGRAGEAGAQRELLAVLDELNPDAIVATNTSVLRITEIAADSARPERVVGTHWWNPPYLIPVVEVVRGERTGEDVARRVSAWLAQAGKTPVDVYRDVPGFVGNRMQFALLREAAWLVEEGVCSAETADLVARMTFGRRWACVGPLRNADFIGLDLTCDILDYLAPSLSDCKQAPRLLRDKVAVRQLGAKSGQGVFEWEEGERDETEAQLLRHLIAAAGKPG